MSRSYNYAEKEKIEYPKTRQIMQIAKLKENAFVV